MTTMFEEDQQIEVKTNRNEEPPERDVIRMTRTRTESTRLNGYERFPDQASNVDGDLIEEAMMMDE